MIDWNRLTRPECQTIRAIARRAHSLLLSSGVDAVLKDIEMDISAAHLASPLDLSRLQTADEFNFAHDICGIHRHIDRETGELQDHFVPRCAVSG